MKSTILIAALISLVIGSLALYIGFQHNPQMEFFDTQTGKIDYFYSFVVFGLWFAMAFILLGVTGGGVVLLIRWMSSRR
jgi:hypothetical protein